MERELYRRVKQLVREALARSGAERIAFLDEACADDPELRGEIDGLLAAMSASTQNVLGPAVARIGAGQAESAFPAPRAVGPYRIHHELGRGGMGIVYAAVDSRDGSAVALKFLSPQLAASRGTRERFEREVRAGQAVDHPNVVRTLGMEHCRVGDAELPILVMEYVEGQTLRQMARELGAVPEALLREVASQILAGLEGIHRAGIVHRDLKPANVLLTPASQVRIMDLGVAKIADVTQDLTREGQFIGSLHYAAPEQFRGEEIGPAADLYSVGVLLYELATRDNPFAAGDVAAVMRAHLVAPVVPVAERSSEVSPFFSEVIGTLMARELTERFPSAAEALRVLEEGEQGAWWREREGEIRARLQRLPPIAVRRVTSVHGRERELEALRKAWTGAVSGDGGAVLVVGEAGIGKSRLVDAFVREVATSPAHVLYGSFPPTGGLHGLTEAVRSRFGDADLEDALAPYLGDEEPLASAVASLVQGGIAPARAPSLLGDALPAVLTRLLRALASELPTLWIVDDLHFASEEARGIALALARGVGGARALVVLTSRPEAVAARAAAFASIPGLLELRLGRLSARQVVDLLQEVFVSETVAEQLAGKIAYKSDGVPFFVFEMLRALEDGRFLARDAQGRLSQRLTVDDIDVPSAVRDLIAARLGEFSREERTALEVAAVQGYEFDAELVARVLELPFVRVLQDLAELERRAGVVRAVGRRHRFDHHQFQEVVYAELPLQLRAEYHTLLADAYGPWTLERQRTTSPADDALFLAHHHLRGSRPVDGLPPLPAALTYLEARFQNAAAIELLDRALELHDELHDTRRAELLLRKAERLDVLARRDEQRAAADAGLALAERLGSVALQTRAQLVRGRLFGALGEPDAALAALSAARGLAQEHGLRAVEIQVGSEEGAMLARVGRVAEAEELLGRAAALAAAAVDPAAEARNLDALAMVLARTGRLHEAREMLERSLARADAADDMRQRATSARRLADVEFALGNSGGAERRYAQALDLAHRCGDRAVVAQARGGRGLTHLARGCVGDAIRDFASQLDIGRQSGDRGLTGMASANLATSLDQLGRWEEAHAHYARAREIGEETSDPRLAGHATLRQAHLCARMGRRTEAHALFDEALELFRRFHAAVSEAETRIHMGELAVCEGDDVAAQAHFEAGARLAGENASPDLRLFAELGLAGVTGEPHDELVRSTLQQVPRMGFVQAFTALYFVWKLTQSGEHLGRLHEMLGTLVAGAPEDDRDEVVGRVPRYAEIEAAIAAG